MTKFLTFFIGGHKWEAFRVSSRSRHLYLDGERLVGACDYATSRIFISSALSPTDFEEIFVHEVLHAMLHVTEATPEFDRKREEAFVKALTPTLHRLLNDFGFKFPEA